MYTVSYIVLGGRHPGFIQDEEKRPEVGDRIELGGELFEIEEIKTLGIDFLHVVCRPVQAESE